MSVRVVSLFAGIGGFDLGATRAGFEIVAHVEKDANCRKLLAARWPTAVALDDVCTAGAHNLPTCDVVVGGSPCQGFSVAGLRKGRNDERSNLTTEYARICDELNPDVLVWENVPGVLSMRDNAFGHFLAAMVGADEPFECADGGGWESAGVATGPKRAVGWRVLDAQWFGVAQRRRRVFLVGVAIGRGGGESGERAGAERVQSLLFNESGVYWDSPPRREAGQGVAGCIESRTTGGGFPGTDGACAGHVVPSIAGTMKSCGGKSGGWTNSADHAAAGYMIPAVAQPIRSNVYNNSDPMMEAKMLIPAVAGCLQERDAKGADSDTKPGHLVPVAFGGDVARTMNARHDSSPCADRGMDVVAVPVAFQPRIGRNGRGYSEGAVPALSGADAGATSDMRPCVATAMQVRRLTPTEAARLQGFPDDWLEGLGFSDSTKYKQLGNAVCVNVAEWIAGRIASTLATGGGS